LGSIGEDFSDVAKAPGYIFRRHIPEVEEIVQELYRSGRRIDRARINALARLGAPALAEWIRSSRRNAIRRGVFEIPDDIFDELSFLFTEDLLDQIYYAVDEGDILTLQRSAFFFGKAYGVTLGNVILFKNDDAFDNLNLWAHEIAHVRQYMRWGINRFAYEYLRSWNSVEAEANRIEGEFLDAY
jgi:hypothetical protein